MSNTNLGYAATPERVALDDAMASYKPGNDLNVLQKLSKVWLATLPSPVSVYKGAK